jgi:RNA polymerase sigma-70 factor (ECF subfamily)
MSDDQRTLLLSAREGDHRAFAALVAGCDRRALSLAFDVPGNAEDAQEAYQEALIAAYRALPRFRMDGQFSTWLYRITLRHALRFRSRRQRRPPPEEWWPEQADHPSPENLALRGSSGAGSTMPWADSRPRNAWPLCCATTNVSRSRRPPN